MALSLASHDLNLPKTSNAQENPQEENEKTHQKDKDLLQTLPKGKGWMTKYLVQYQGHWLTPTLALERGLVGPKPLHG